MLETLTLGRLECTEEDEILMQSTSITDFILTLWFK